MKGKRRGGLERPGAADTPAVVSAFDYDFARKAAATGIDLEWKVAPGESLRGSLTPEQWKNLSPANRELVTEFVRIHFDRMVAGRNTSGYNAVVENAADLNNLAAELGLPFDEAKRALLERAKGPREVVSRAEGMPRPKWETDRQRGETPAAFIKRAYAAEISAGDLHKGIIHSKDPPLYRALFKWLAEPGNGLGFDLPTKKEWNDRRLAAAGGIPERSKDLGLYEVAVKRRAAGRRRALG